MKYYYDLHLHSCLSPCGDMDMTPNNITGMAKLLGLDIIALTDHNTCRNCEATIAAGKENGVVVVPGMELTTSEDIHAVCLFPNLERAMEWSDYVDSHRIKVRNRPDIYGRQVMMNALDEETGEIEHLLLPASEISIMNAYKIVKDFGGICYPAHVALRKLHPILDTLNLVTSSDAHYLENMRDAENRIELEELTAECLVRTLDLPKI